MASAGAFAALGDVPAPPLHIPDGFVSLPVAAAGWAAAAAVVVVAARRAERDLDERAAPLMGVLAAFIFAAQMVNFPVAGGTSGHLLGGVLAAILLGPWAAIIVMTAVIVLQALIFQDGGLAAAGVNTLNVAVIAVLVGWGAYRVLRRLDALHPAAAAAAAFAGAWLSVEAAAVATALELAASGTSPLAVALPAMVGVHAAIGIGEGLITLGALGLVRAWRPDLLAPPRRAEG